MNRTNWIDFEQWQKIGQPIKSTSSLQAVKLFDAAVCQYASWYDNDSLGGLMATIEKMLTADPEFLLGKSFQLVTTLMGYTETSFNNEQLAYQIKTLSEDAEKRKDEITNREYNHVQAAVKFANMDWPAASIYWENILKECPTDMFALKSELFCNFFTGEKMKNFKMIQNIYSEFDKIPNYHSEAIHGYYAFVQEEVGLYNSAESLAYKGLELYPWDGWTTHSLAHILEKKGNINDGKNIMARTIELWNRANHIGCHNWWHLALFNVSLDDYDSAIEILDTEVMPRAKESQAIGAISDMNALLYRLLFLNKQNFHYDDEFFEERFENAYQISKQYHKDKLVNPFVTNHYAIACLGSKRKTEAQELLEDFRRSKHAELYPKVNQIGCDIIQAFIYHDQGNYSKAANILAPIRNEIVQIGGSDAQRDLFDQLLLVCTLKSSLPEHRDLFKVLVDEREHTKHGDDFITKITK